MAPTLRKRLSKKQPSWTSQSKSRDGTPSPESPALTATNSLPNDMANLDIKDTPLLTPKHKRSLQARESSRNNTPPQSLLERYKRSAATTQITTDSSTGFQSQIPRLMRSNASTGTAFSEQFDHALSPAAIDEMEKPGAPGSEDPSPMIRKVNRIDFEMMRQKRFQSSLQQDSESSATVQEDPDMPRALTIRKVQAADDSQSSPTTSDSADEVEDEDSFEDADVPAPLKLHNGPPTRISSYRQARQEEKGSHTPPPPVTVKPPPYNDKMCAGFQWVSPVATTSRPQEPWGWMKKWTCCKCAHLDPFGRGTPAQTMVEQTNCARLGCKHERCADGCKMIPAVPGSRIYG